MPNDVTGAPEQASDFEHEHPDVRVTVFVDADATPRDALQTVDRVAAQLGADVITVSSLNHQYDRVGHVSVDPHPQAVDLEIIRRLKQGPRQIVVTQDYGLAALTLGKGAAAISPMGLVFTEQNIDRLLFERELHAHERKMTGRSRGPKKRTDADAARFRTAFTQLLEEVLHS